MKRLRVQFSTGIISTINKKHWESQNWKPPCMVICFVPSLKWRNYCRLLWKLQRPKQN